MKASSGNVLFAVLLIGIASVLGAQQPPSTNQQEIERIRDDLEPIRRSRLVGSNDSLAIEMPDGKLTSVARNAGCAPPVFSGGVIMVDCAVLNDGPVHYFDEGTRAMIESCPSWSADAKRCPPRQWPIELPDCDGAVPQGVTGTWRFYALPGADGFYPVTVGWAMTLEDGSISFDFYGVEQSERSYTVIYRGERRYELRIEDDRGATTAAAIELAPCGMIVETAAMCDVFCENLAGGFGTSTEPQPRKPEPLFPKRAYFRLATSD
jgi:hypothetical protein